VRLLDWLFILFCILDFREGFDDVAEDLLKKLIALDQSERISVEEAIDHPFFDSIRDFEEKQIIIWWYFWGITKKKYFLLLKSQTKKQYHPSAITSLSSNNTALN